MNTTNYAIRLLPDASVERGNPDSAGRADRMPNGVYKRAVVVSFQRAARCITHCATRCHESVARLTHASRQTNARGGAMRVLMVSDVYFPRINGVSTSIQTFRNEFARVGVEVTLIAPEYPGQVQPRGEDAEDVIRIASRGVPLDPEDRMMKRSRIDALLPVLRERNFDVVHIQTPFVAHYAGVRLARELGLPVLATYHTFFQEYLFHYFPFVPKGWMRALARRFSRSQCNELDAIVVPSSPMRDALLGYGVTKRMHVLPTGLPDAAFVAGNGTRFRMRYGIPAGRPVALFVGRVAFEKNIDFLLRVVAEARRALPNLLFVIAGEGPALGALKSQAERSGIQGNVLFVGYMNRETELPDCYSAADAFVFASRTETQGLVLLEAMALGVPVVSTAVMGTRDVLLRDGKPVPGSVVVEDDVGLFAKELVGLFLAPDRRQALSAGAVDYARTWQAGAMASRLAGVYADLVAGTVRGGVSVAGAVEAG
jgi:glycosyltransferase involved in cell wall biosynthesis